MSRTTRRELVGIAAGSMAAAGAWPGTAAAGGAAGARCEVRRPGVRRTTIVLARDGRSAWTADVGTRSLTAHDVRSATPRETVTLPAAPVGLALLGGGRQAVAVLEGAGVAVVDLRTRRVVTRYDAGPSARAVAADPAGHAAVVVGGGPEGWLRALDPATGVPWPGTPITIGPHPRGVALADRRTAVVTLNGAAAVAVVDLAERTVRTIATAPFPGAVVAAGRRAWVSHDGFEARQVTPLALDDLRAGVPWRTGADPGGLSLLRSGRVLAVAERGAGRLALHDAVTGRRRASVVVGGTPRAVAAAGRRAVVVDDETGRVTAVAA